MKSIAIVTDSNCGMSPAQAKDLGIYMLPMPFFIDDKEYEITGIRYKNGKWLGLEADNHVWHNKDDYPEERKWIIVKDKNGTEHKYHQWMGHTYYEFIFDADGCDGYRSDVDIASWRYDYSDKEK